ncbi:hypothetical protein MP638_004114 [Amoeboaphelidium occidentale]|nr:hypothetical protein MP638_004114 [Amoeboaphelidium occidentale]
MDQMAEQKPPSLDQLPPTALHIIGLRCGKRSLHKLMRCNRRLAEVYNDPLFKAKWYINNFDYPLNRALLRGEKDSRVYEMIALNAQRLAYSGYDAIPYIPHGLNRQKLFRDSMNELNAEAVTSGEARKILAIFIHLNSYLHEMGHYLTLLDYSLTSRHIGPIQLQHYSLTSRHIGPIQLQRDKRITRFKETLRLAYDMALRIPNMVEGAVERMVVRTCISHASQSNIVIPLDEAAVLWSEYFECFFGEFLGLSKAAKRRVMENVFITEISTLKSPKGLGAAIILIRIWMSFSNRDIIVKYLLSCINHTIYMHRNLELTTFLGIYRELEVRAEDAASLASSFTENYLKSSLQNAKGMDEKINIIENNIPENLRAQFWVELRKKILMMRMNLNNAQVTVINTVLNMAAKRVPVSPTEISQTELITAFVHILAWGLKADVAKKKLTDLLKHAVSFGVEKNALLATLLQKKGVPGISQVFLVTSCIYKELCTTDNLKTVILNDPTDFELICRAVQSCNYHSFNIVAILDELKEWYAKMGYSAAFCNCIDYCNLDKYHSATSKQQRAQDEKIAIAKSHKTIREFITMKNTHKFRVNKKMKKKH